MSVVPIPRLEGIAGPLKEITLHGNAVLCIHIVLQLGVVIREVLNNREEKKMEKEARVSEQMKEEERGEKRQKTSNGSVKRKYSIESAFTVLISCICLVLVIFSHVE